MESLTLRAVGLLLQQGCMRALRPHRWSLQVDLADRRPQLLLNNDNRAVRRLGAPVGFEPSSAEECYGRRKRESGSAAEVFDTLLQGSGETLRMRRLAWIHEFTFLNT
jgi:hypothetical protein